VAEETYYEDINFRGKPITVASRFLLDADPGHRLLPLIRVRIPPLYCVDLPLRPDRDEISVTNLDETFLKKVMESISENMLDPDFNVNQLQELIFISREHLYRKLVAITGESPSSLIRKMRLKTAASMLREGGSNITEVRFM